MVPPRLPSIAAVALVVVMPLLGAVPFADGVGQPALVHDTVDEPDGNVTLLRGESGLFRSARSAADFRAARANGSLRPAPFLVAGDTLVLRFRSPRLDDRMDAAVGGNATDALFRHLNDTDDDLALEGRGHGTSQLPADLLLNRSNTAVHRDRDNETFWIAIDTGRVDIVQRDDREPVIRDLPHFEFAAVVTIATADGEPRVLVGRSAFLPGDARLGSPDPGTYFDSVPASVRANATRNLTITGSTPLLEGTALLVRAVDTNGTVLARERVRTGPENRSDAPPEYSAFTRTLPTDRLPADAAFDLVVTRGGHEVADRRVVVGRPAAMWNLTAEYRTEGSHEGEIAVGATSHLPAAGFLSVQVDGESVSTRVPEDRTVRSTVYVDREAANEEGEVYVLAIWDANGDGRLDPDADRLYWTSADLGASRTDDELDALVPVVGLPTTATTTSTRSTTRASTTDRTTARTPTTSTVGTPTTTRGFEWPVAIAGMAAVLFLLLWRR